MEPGILTVTETASGYAEATSVHLAITIEGSHLFSGNAAIEKCEEVKGAVYAIRRADPNAAFYVKRIHMKLESGRVTRSSKALYSLEVTPTNLAFLGDVLGALFDLKTVALGALDWVYEEDGVRLEIASQAMARAQAKAAAMAAAVGHQVLGIRTCTDCITVRLEYAPNGHTTAADLGPAIPRMMQMSPTARAADFGTELRARRDLAATATVEFMIGKAG